MDGVLYLAAGLKHGVHTAVSLATLRDHYSGPVAIITDEQGKPNADLMASDPRMGQVHVIIGEGIAAGSHGVSYYSKTLLPGLSPFGRTVFLDADTIVVGKFDEVWSRQADEVVLTQFADWVATGGKMSQRIEPWREFDAPRVERMLRACDSQKPNTVLHRGKWIYPGLNTGVIGWAKGCQAFARDWNATCKKRNAFIVDETAAQLIFPDYNCRVLDDRFNCSVVYQPQHECVATRQDVRIWHGHGGKFWKRDAGQLIYLPKLWHCLQENLANVRRIAPWPKYLGSMLKDQPHILPELKAQIAQAFKAPIL